MSVMEVGVGGIGRHWSLGGMLEVTVTGSVKGSPSEVSAGGRRVNIGRWELEESTGVGRLLKRMEGRVVYLGIMGVAGSQSMESDTRIEEVSGTNTFQER